MAKPNYSFEKRQRELAKKKKKEEKLKEKEARKANPGQAMTDEPAETSQGNTPTSELPVENKVAP
jgi:hypothetical protein